MIQLIEDFWEYLGKSQPNFIRITHIAIALLIISQIIVSNFMMVNYHQSILNIWGWIHVVTGFLILLLFITFFIFTILKRGFKYFYPYLFNHFSQLKIDITSLFKLKLPAVKPYGLITTAQGLGFGALILVLGSGLLWFIAWNLHWTYAGHIQSWHKTLTGLIEIYIIGHGVMGVLHFLIEKYFPDNIN